MEEVTLERKELEVQYAENQELAMKYNEDIGKLKNEFEKMKKMITNTFEDELKTTPSMLGSNRKRSKSPVKND